MRIPNLGTIAAILGAALIASMVVFTIWRAAGAFVLKIGQ